MENIDARAYLASGAIVVGDVEIGEDVGIWYHATIRGDRALIRISKGTNVQDNCVIHAGSNHPVVIGEFCTIGHGAILHGCQIEENTVIGMGAIVMNGCKIGRNCIIGAGTLLTQNTTIPDHSVVIGSPGKVIRSITEEEIISNRKNAETYITLAKQSAL
jgi:carbonic anhydrase/acetyltransferase-like protein (isoleucine patch superfamily)